jgi:tetratricopeptide (TPR) repeat protein
MSDVTEVNDALRARKLLEALSAAAAMLQQQHVTEAEGIARAVLEAHPGQPEALHLLGLGARARGDLDEAGEYILQAVRSQPRHAPYHASLGLVFLEQRAWTEAERALDLALRLDPELVHARYNRANLYLQTGRGNLAVSELDAVLEVDAGNAGAHHNLASALLQLGERERAREHLREACRLAPAASTPWQSLARAEAEDGHLQAALEALESALENNAGAGEPHLFRGQILQTLGRFEDAEEAFRIFLEMRPRDPFLASQALQAMDLGDGFPETDWLGYAELWREQHVLPLLRRTGNAATPTNTAPAPGRSRPRIAFLSVSGEGPSGWLPDLLRACHAAGADVHLWCVHPPRSIPEGVEVHRLETGDPAQIAGVLRESHPDAMVQVGGLAAPELLVAALLRPAPRIVVWASHPRLGFPEIDFRFTTANVPDGRLTERPLLVPAGAWPAGTSPATAPTADVTGAIIVPSPPATLSPWRLSLLHALVGASGRPIVLLHPDFELAEIRLALAERWHALGRVAEPLFQRNPTSAALLVEAGPAAPDSGSLAALARGIPVLSLHPHHDPVARAAWAHLWAGAPEVIAVPPEAAATDTVATWSDGIARMLADPVRWGQLSQTAREPGQPLISDLLAARLLEMLPGMHLADS